MRKTLPSCLFVLFIVTNVFAQYNTNQNKVWAFGKQAGLDFTSGAPVPTTCAFNTSAAIPNRFIEACASVCDASGNLLFYTDGQNVYNRNHVLMPNGDSLVPYETWSTTQGAAIVPVIGSETKFFVFSLQQFGTAAEGYLAYSTVDIMLDGGYGDVVPISKGIIFADSLTEKMIAVAGNNDNIWLLTHKKDTGIFLAYEITAAGIDTTPVVSVTGHFHGLNAYSTGVIKVSHDRLKLVSQAPLCGPLDMMGTELYDFDPATGMVSNCIILDSSTMQYGAEFSPDNTKLYTCERLSAGVNIKQFDVSLSSPDLMRASKKLINFLYPYYASDLKLGPDGKIYLSGIQDSLYSIKCSRFMDCITNPNLSGAACGYVFNAIEFPGGAGTGMQFGLPTTVVSVAVTNSVRETYIQSTISLFPNPTTTSLTVTASEKITWLSISNTIGREVYKQEYNNEMVKVDVSTLPPGIYFVKVNGTSVQKFVKQ